LNLSRRIEAILFTRDEAVSAAQLAQALATSEDAVRTALDDLVARYETSAMTLVQVKDGWRLQLRSDYFEAVAAFAHHPLIDGVGVARKLLARSREEFPELGYLS